MGLKKIQIAALLVVLTLSARFLKIRHILQFLHQAALILPASSIGAEKKIDFSKKTARLVMLINREYSFYGASCLAESLALWWLLRRRGIFADFYLGVRTITGPFESHAWVQLKQTALNDLNHINTVYTPYNLTSFLFKEQPL